MTNNSPEASGHFEPLSPDDVELQHRTEVDAAKGNLTRALDEARHTLDTTDLAQTLSEGLDETDLVVVDAGPIDRALNPTATLRLGARTNSTHESVVLGARVSKEVRKRILLRNLRQVQQSRTPDNKD